MDSYSFTDSNKHCNTILQNCSSTEQYCFVDVYILYETCKLFNTGGDGDKLLGDGVQTVVNYMGMGIKVTGMGKILWRWGGDGADIYYRVTL